MRSRYCIKHPKYKGKKKPKTQCEGCLTIYFNRGSNVRKPTAPPSKVFQDKSKFNRKRKHQEFWSGDDE